MAWETVDSILKLYRYLCAGECMLIHQGTGIYMGRKEEG